MNGLFVTVFLFTIILRINGDVCDFCQCDCDSIEMSENSCTDGAAETIECDANDSRIKPNPQLFDLNSIQWPNRNTTASVRFNHFKMTYLTNVLCSASTPSNKPILTAINLDNNAIGYIVNDPFQHCKNLTTISIANNLIGHLSSEFFESTHSLVRLNISHNALSEFNGGILSRCKHIVELDMSNNQIRTLKVNEILDASPNVKIINAANNLLFALSDNNQNKYVLFKSLNLSGNKMTVLTSNTFPSYPSLKYLNVSSNELGNIEPNTFEDLADLHILDLSGNNLRDISLKLPDGIEHLSLARNQLKYWPLAQFPKNLHILELQDNQMTEMFTTVAGKRIEYPPLKILNVSHNHINLLLPTLIFPAMEVFDASYNDFISIPSYLGAQAPSLKVLKLRGNPIKKIEFYTKMSANILDLSELKITELDAKVFNSIEPKHDCVELIISHNVALQKIQNSFIRVPNLCGLDLSYNNINIIDHNWMNWSALDRGINFQGNPIDCSCGSQWLLDYFLPSLYKNTENHRYLYEFRCAYPAHFKGHRLVRYLNHSDAFCKSEITSAKFRLYLDEFSQENDDFELVWYRGIGLWLIIVLTLAILALSVSIFVILVRRSQERRKINRNNRRFTD